jgi:hypothetical protein
MAETYTQGLIVAEGVRVRRERRLPVEGDVLVSDGQTVARETVLARTELPGRAEVVKAASLLGIAPTEIRNRLLKKEGDPVEEGELLGQSSGWFGLFKSSCTSPISGHVESVSPVTGHVIVRGHPVPLEVQAYLDGKIIEVFPGEGALVETRAILVQGIFGLGGERWGDLVAGVDGPDEPLEPSRLDESCRGNIVVAGRGLAPGSMERAEELGVLGLVVGSIRDADLRELLGYDLGSAITGSEPIGVTLVVTEGFGDLAMAARTFDTLVSGLGRRVSVNGKTQIRAGVIRPEVVIPMASGGDEPASIPAGSLEKGARVRGARAPYFGRVGTVTGLPPALARIETGAEVRVAELTFEDGSRALVPRSNIEAI